jgi:uncharacterized protein YkwD
MNFFRRLFPRQAQPADAVTPVAAALTLRAPVPPLQADQVPRHLPRLLWLHNRERQQHNRPSLLQREALDMAAGAHAVQMALMSQLAHAGIGDGSPVTRLQGLHYPATFVGENVAYGMPTADLVFEHWLDSTNHRANILSDRYAHIGLALALGSRGDAFWCVVYSGGAGSAASHRRHTVQLTAGVWTTTDGFVLCPAFAAEV